MAVRKLTNDEGAPVVLKLRAGYAAVRLRVDDDARTAAVTLTGPQDCLDKVTETSRPGNWDIRIPNDGGGGSIQVNSFSSAGGRATIIRSGGGGTVIHGGSMVIGDISMGGGRSSTGRVVVDGVDVTEYVRGQHGSGAGDGTGLTADIVLPAGSSADLRVDEGDVTLTGELDAQVETSGANVTVIGVLKSGMIKTRNADVNVQSGGDVTLETHNGNIDLDDAHGQTMVTTHNGNARVHATASIPVMASSHNGDVNVTRAPGTSPKVMATTHNGRVRKP